MSTSRLGQTPGLSSFLRSLKTNPVESSIEQLILLLKRRQIRHSKPCAIATTQLLLQVVADSNERDVARLLARVRHVGVRLTSAQPKEMAVGNIVRRVLGLIREVAEDEEIDEETPAVSDASTPQPIHDSSRRSGLKSSTSTFSPLRHGAKESSDSELQELEEEDAASQDATNRPPLLTSHTSYAQPGAPLVHSLFGLFSGNMTGTSSPGGTPVIGSGAASPATRALSEANLANLSISDADRTTTKDIKADVVEGIREILDELDQAAEQIAANALEHIHADEIVLVHGSSTTVQKFLYTAARKRKFTVIQVESYPNDHIDTYSMVFNGRKAGKGAQAGVDDEEEAFEDSRIKPLTALGTNVIVIPDSAVFAIMSRVNKVILSTHSVLANGGLVASVGALNIAQAAKAHKTPVVVLSGVYKLSPLYPFDLEELIEYGDASKVIPYQDGEFVSKVDVTNPLSDYVPESLVDLYITNLGGHAPSYLYRIVADHYSAEDVTLS